VKKLVISISIAVLALAAMFGAIQIAAGQTPRPEGATQIVQNETQGENVRQIEAPVGQDTTQAPDIGFIDSPTASCFQPDSTRDECFINWYYMSVDASPNYMITMTVTINSIGKVAHHQGFFQTSMYVPYNMNSRGYKVACGALGSGGNPYLGMAYAYTIRARDSANLGSANYGTTYCPAYTP
jgi:hypothetical protein